MARAARAEGNLPVPVTRFVGRRDDVTRLRRLLQESRLVTLTGVGGVGKTRLALELARQVRRAFPGGTWMVDLSAVADAGQIPQAVATVFGVPDRSTRPPADILADRLRGRRVLLLLDNCEHLAQGSAAFVTSLLRQLDEVTVLATSRIVLGAEGERLFPVLPLGVPGGPGTDTTETIGRSDAVQLLLDRARALHPGFALTDDNRVAVARLCARLDGLPLAIELAASRLRTLSVEQLVDRLEGRFALLTVGQGTAPGRQALRAVMDWSHSLCSPAERLLWARLSAFAGGFDLEAAETVCAGPDLDRGDILDVLDRLVAQSIVSTDADGQRVRFRLLETLRQYGRQRLAALGEETELLRRHRDHYLTVARTTAAAWCTPGQQTGLARLRTEHANLRTAIETSMADPDGPESALALVSALRQHWYADAFLGEGRRWLDRVLALPHHGPDGGARTDALWVAAWVCLLQGDQALARERLTACEAAVRRTGDRRAAGFAAKLRGTDLLFSGRLPEAAAAFEDSLAIFADIGETEGQLWGMFQLAITLAHTGDSGRARAICRESIELSAATGDRLCRSYTLWVLGFDTWLHDEADRADRLARDGLALQRDFNDPIGAALILELTSWIAASRGQLQEAARLLGTADGVWSLIGTTLAAFGPPLQAHRDACERRVRSGLDPDSAQQARDRGRHGDVESAIAAALASASVSDPPSDVPDPTPEHTPLTHRESEVAGLMAQGLSNRVIAARLVISPRTVDGHVERILAKLGFTTRAQVAAWVAAREHSGG